ncbi:hypothetical protein PTNB85_10592 [Pyrenophora teres f. teres]|nr:hypothetical protein PTNB85_10594 [Pyrenophora teres f. teres]KAE8821972.1 hypothetical protein PTNB85_10592 [Pyrenophora teres f. teres]KAE8822094.1 hypothetical protein HRS9139_10466 [Pyrenophora teres f. teres]
MKDKTVSGGFELFTRAQKDEIIRITTQDRNHREQEAWQAIQRRDYDAIAPHLSVSTLENIMYEAGYKRRKPGSKSPLSSSQRRERLQWALNHDPDCDEVGDGLGSDFKKVVFTDETPVRVGEERGMIRTWVRDDEIYADSVRHDRNRKDCCLQFFKQIEKLAWPGHSPDINASEHAWPWLRSYVRKQFTPSCNAEECKSQ